MRRFGTRIEVCLKSTDEPLKWFDEHSPSAWALAQKIINHIPPTVGEDP